MCKEFPFLILVGGSEANILASIVNGAFDECGEYKILVTTIPPPPPCNMRFTAE